MKLKRVLATVLSAAMVLSCLAGCGSSTADTSAGSTSSSASTDSASTDSASADSGEVQEITWMFWDDLNATEDLISIGYKETIDRFNKDYEGKYHVTPITTNLEEYYTKLNALVAAGETPDVFIASPGANLNDYALTGVAAKLDDYLADGWKDTFTSDAVFAGGTYSDGIYAIPLNIAAACVFYNTEMFEKAGAEVPKTFDELLTSCQKLQDAGYTPITISAGTAWCLSMVAGYLCDRNGLVLSDIADHKTDWKDEKVINAGKQIQELSKYFQKTAAGDDNDIATAAFYNEEAAILIQGSWAIGQINGSCAEGFADKVGVFAFPAVTGGNPDANLSLIHISRKSAMQESLIRLSLVWQQREWTLRKRTGSRSLKRRFRKRPSKLIPGHLKPDMHLDRTGQLTLGMQDTEVQAGRTFDIKTKRKRRQGNKSDME